MFTKNYTDKINDKHSTFKWICELMDTKYSSATAKRSLNAL